MENFGGLFDYHAVDFLQKLSFERQNKVKSAYLFSYVDGPPASSPLRRDLLSTDNSIKLFQPDNEFLRQAAQYAAKFLADRPCPEEYSRPPTPLLRHVDVQEPRPWTAGVLLAGEADEAAEDSQFRSWEVEKQEKHSIDGLAKGELLLREPPLRWSAHRPDWLDVESMLAQSLQKSAVECLDEYITIDDQPLEDIRLLRKYIPSAGEQQCAMENLSGDESSRCVGEDESCLSASALEDKVLEAASVAIEEATAVFSSQPSPSQRTGSAEESRSDQPPVRIESSPSQPASPLAGLQNERGGSDDTTPPSKLADSENTATPSSEQSRHKDRKVSDNSKITHSQDKTLSMPSSLGEMLDGTVTGGAGAPVTLGECISAVTHSGHEVRSLSEGDNSVKPSTFTSFAPLDTDWTPYNINKPTPTAQCESTTGFQSSNGEHKVLVVKKLEKCCFGAEDVTGKDIETANPSHASVSRGTWTEAHRTREASCSDRLNVVKANLLIDKKENVAVVAPRTVGQKESKTPPFASAESEPMVQLEPVSFSAIFDDDWEDAFPPAEETDAVIGACVTAEPGASACAVFDGPSRDNESIEEHSDAEGEGRQNSKAGDTAWPHSPPSKRSKLPPQLGTQQTSPSGRMNMKGHREADHGHSSRRYSARPRSDSPDSYQNATGRQASDIGGISASVSSPSFELANELDEVGNESEFYCERGQDPLSQGWSAKIFEAPLSDGSGSWLATPPRNQTGNTRANLGTPESDSLIIDESRIRLATSSDEEAFGMPTVGSTGQELIESGQEMSAWDSPTPQAGTNENAFRLFTDVPENFSAEASPYRKVNLDKLKERGSATVSLSRNKLSDWYKPLNGGSSNLEPQARSGSNLGQGNSTASGAKARRKSCVLNSSKLFRSKRKLGPLCDQANRITRYFPAKECADTVSPERSGHKGWQGTRNVPDLNNFRYSRVEAGARRTVNAVVAPLGAPPKVERGNDYCSNGAQGGAPPASAVRTRQSGASFLEHSDWPQSADPGRYSLARSSAATSLRTSKDTWPANVQVRPFPFSGSDSRVRRKSDLQKTPVRFEYDQGTQDIRARNTEDRNASLKCARLDDAQENGTPLKGVSAKGGPSSTGISRRPLPGASSTLSFQLPQAQTNNYEMNRGSFAAAENLREIGSDICYEMEDGDFSDTAWNGRLADERGAHVDKVVQDDIGQRTDRGREQGFNKNNGHRVSEMVVTRAPAVPAFRPSNALCSIERTNRQTTRFEKSGEQDGEIEGYEHAWADMNSSGFYENQRALPGSSYHKVAPLDGRDAINEDVLNNDLYRPKRAEGLAVFEDSTTDNYYCEQWPLYEEAGDEPGTIRRATPEGEVDAQCNEACWDDGADITASEEEQERVRRIIEETLHIPARAVMPARSGITRNGRGGTARQLTVPARSSVRLDSAANSDLNGAECSTLVSADRGRQSDVAILSPAIVEQGIARSVQQEAGGARGTSLRWPRPLNVKNLAAKLVAPQPQRKQLDASSIRQLLKPTKNNNVWASNFMSIRGVKLQSSEAVTKSPKH